MFSTEIFCYVKFLEYGWSKFYKTEAALCHMVISKITLLYGVKDEFYYKQVIAPMIHIKYCNSKSTFQNTLRDSGMGEFMPLFNLVIL